VAVPHTALAQLGTFEYAYVLQPIRAFSVAGLNL
jgi:hypothetical protein